jgi:tryptophan synthase alpha chain
MTACIHKYTDLPVAVGFGISSPEQARLVANQADAVVVGSAIVNQIAAHGSSDQLVAHTAEFVKKIANAIKG